MAGGRHNYERSERQSRVMTRIRTRLVQQLEFQRLAIAALRDTVSQRVHLEG